MNPTSDPAARLSRLEAYLQQDPSNPRLLQDAIDEALRMGAADRAEFLAQRAVDTAPEAADCMHLLATVRLSQGRCDEAIELLRRVIATGVAAPGVRFNLGYALFRAGFLSEAIAEFESLYAQAQAPAGTLAQLMRCLHHRGDLERIQALWHEAGDQFRTAEAKGVVSLALFDADDLVQARELSEQALQGAGFSAEASVARAGICIAENRATEAIALLERALSRNMTDGRTWATLGVAHMMARDVSRAREACEHATRYLPRHIGSWHGLAWCQILSQDLEGARASFEQAMAIDRNFGETHGGLAVVAAMQGRESDANASIERALRLDSQALSARFARALLDGETRDAAAFERLAMRLLGQRPGPLGGSLADHLRTSTNPQGADSCR